MILGQRMTKNRIYPDRNNILVSAVYVGVVPTLTAGPESTQNQHTKSSHLRDLNPGPMLYESMKPLHGAIKRAISCNGGNRIR